MGRAPVADVEPVDGVGGPRAVHAVQQDELLLRADRRRLDLFLDLDSRLA